MKIFCINLKRSIDRRTRMVGEFQKLGLPYEFIDGVDGRLLSESELRQSYSKVRTIFRYGHPLLPSEVGCAMSHVKCYDSFLRSAERVCFVFEDDVIFHDKVMRQALEEANRLLENAQEPMLIEFPARARDFPKSYIRHQGKFGLVRSTNGTYAYGINRSAARILEEEFKVVKMPIDHYSYVVSRLGLKIFLRTEQVASFNDESASLIGEGRHLRMNKIVYCLYKIYRCFGMLMDAVLSVHENHAIRNSICKD